MDAINRCGILADPRPPRLRGHFMPSFLWRNTVIPMELNWEHRLPASRDETMRQIIRLAINELKKLKKVLASSQEEVFGEERKSSLEILVMA